MLKCSSKYFNWVSQLVGYSMSQWVSESVSQWVSQAIWLSKVRELENFRERAEGFENSKNSLNLSLIIEGRVLRVFISQLVLELP